MTASNGILALVGAAAIRYDVDRVAAAAGLSVAHAADPSSSRVWTAAAAVLVDVAAARRCAHRACRGVVALFCWSEPSRAADYQAAIAVGAQHVIALPGHDGELMAELSDAAEPFASCAREAARLAARGDDGSTGMPHNASRPTAQLYSYGAMVSSWSRGSPRSRRCCLAEPGPR